MTIATLFRFLLVLALSILAVVVIRATTSSSHYPYVVVAGPTGIKFAILQHPVSDATTCNTLGENIGSTVLARCANCEISEQSCLSHPPPELKLLLSEAPIDVPTARLNNGAMAFYHADPNMALQVCLESERQAISRAKHKFVCDAPTKPRPFPAGYAKPTNSPGTVLTFAKWALIFFIPTVALLVAIQLLAVRSPTELYSVPSPTAAPFKPSNLAKRVLDVFGALFLIVVISPLLIVVAAVLFVLEGTPIFYVSRRLISSEDAVPIMKFRTMVRDASTSKYRLRERFMRNGYLDIPLSCEVYTPVGRLLERTQLVETLQLFNILIHGMSFVGNRPLPKDNVELLKQFKGWQQRFESPAGITGITQIVGKYGLAPQQRLYLERMYSSVYKNKAANVLLCDSLIITYTVFLLISGRYLDYDQAVRLLIRCGAKLPANGDAVFSEPKAESSSGNE